MADLYGKHPQIASLKAAVLAGEAFKKAVVFEHFISHYRPSVIVFNRLDTACTWLGIDTGEAELMLRSLRDSSRESMNR